jgi:predicted Rossmann fold flavoprotein
MTPENRIYHTAVLGGGAAGLVAAISAQRKGNSVVICERMPVIGKKLLITGGGRCNLLNETLDESFYTATDIGLVREVFKRFGKKEILKFFEELGLRVYAEGHRIFPFTNQASSVIKVLEMEIQRSRIQVALDYEVFKIETTGHGFSLLAGNGRRVDCRAVVVAAGGKSYPALGSNGSGYPLAALFGHHIIDPVPSAVPLVVKDRLCHLLQGIKVTARVESLIDGRAAEKASGDVLFTKYGLSGTAVLDVSESISKALNRGRSAKRPEVEISVDFIPFISREGLKEELERRGGRGFRQEELLTGILPNRFAAIAGKAIGEGAASLKDRRFRVFGTRGWNEAEFTAGGIDAGEVNARTLESRSQKGLYFAGEILDVQGRRGGYNLAWAWASGFVAGLTE